MSRRASHLGSCSSTGATGGCPALPSRWFPPPPACRRYTRRLASSKSTWATSRKSQMDPGPSEARRASRCCRKDTASRAMAWAIRPRSARRSRTSCLVLRPTPCHRGSSCRRTISSKLLKSPCSTVSSTASRLRLRRSSFRHSSMASASALCTALIASVSSTLTFTTSGASASRQSLTCASNRGQSSSRRTCRAFITRSTLAREYPSRWGWSSRPRTKPRPPPSRYSRTAKPSPLLSVARAALSTRKPASRRAGSRADSRSTVRMRVVTCATPPAAYSRRRSASGSSLVTSAMGGPP
mmetsp:Transcript_24116/g.67583  ORF Transcript_24116/g.67583 Transcript_24116/m.67583 type:complete len:297 (+) Transcript_24116:28-918(+)